MYFRVYEQKAEEKPRATDIYTCTSLKQVQVQKHATFPPFGKEKYNPELSFWLNSDREAPRAHGYTSRQPTDLEGLDDDEDVVHADGQHEEGDDLDDDEGEGNAGVAEDAQRARDGA